MDTVNVEIFTLYIFSRYSCFSNIRENMNKLKITCIMPYRASNIKNLSPREIANFCKFAKIYTRDNIFVRSN